MLQIKIVFPLPSDKWPWIRNGFSGKFSARRLNFGLSARQHHIPAPGLVSQMLCFKNGNIPLLLGIEVGHMCHNSEG